MSNLLFAYLMLSQNNSPATAMQMAVGVVQEFGPQTKLATQIIMVESRGKAGAINLKTSDYGLMQINSVHKLPKACLLDWQCNIKYAHSILKKSSRLCAYNLGNKGSKKNLKSCLRYELKVANVSLQEVMKCQK